MELVIAFLGLWAFLLFAPDAQICRTLHRPLIELPAKFFGLIARRHAAMTAGFLALAAAAFWLIDHELLLVMSLMAPEALAYLTMFEIGTLVEVFFTTTLIAASARLPRFAILVGAIRARVRPARTRRPRRPTPSNDDDEGPAFLMPDRTWPPDRQPQPIGASSTASSRFSGRI